MTAIIDYKAGNLTSVKLAFAALGAEAVVTSDPKVIAAADRVMAAADLPHPGGKLPRSGPSARFANGPQQPRGGHGIVPQPLLFDVKGKILIH